MYLDILITMACLTCANRSCCIYLLNDTSSKSSWYTYCEIWYNQSPYLIVTSVNYDQLSSRTIENVLYNSKLIECRRNRNSHAFTGTRTCAWTLTGIYVEQEIVWSIEDTKTVSYTKRRHDGGWKSCTTQRWTWPGVIDLRVYSKFTEPMAPFNTTALVLNQLFKASWRPKPNLTRSMQMSAYSINEGAAKLQHESTWVWNQGKLLWLTAQVI